MGIRTYELTQPETLDDLKTEVIDAQRNDSPLEVQGRETGNDLQRSLGKEALRSFSISLWLIQLGADYSIQGQETSSGDGITISVEPRSGKLTLLEVSDD